MFPTLKDMTVLFVEDDFLTREALKGVLENFCTILVAEDGAKGIEMYKNNHIDIILTDIRMPILDGISMAREIKQINPNTPIVILSAHSDYEYLIEAIEIDINEYILKPINTHKLLEKIEKIAKKIDLAREIDEKNKQLLAYSKFVAMGEVLQMIAHQWRQPITSISSILQSIAIKDKIGKLSSEDIQSSVEMAKDITKELSKTIDNFNSLFSIDKETIDTSLSSLIHIALSLITIELQQKDIKLDFSITEDININILKNNFIQVLLSILTNAIEALIQNNVQNPTIKIYINQQNDKILINIEDNAGGIPLDIISKIFEPYFSTKSKNGRGLGLYMAKLVTEQYLGGNIDVKNSQNGAIFSVILPNH